MAQAGIDTENSRGETGIPESGSVTGNVQTFTAAGAVVSNYSWSVNTTGTMVDFFFTVDNTDGNNGFNVLAADITNTIAGTMVTLDTTGTPETAAAGYGILSKYSGDAATAIGTTGFTVDAGNTTTFRVRYSVGSTTAAAAVAADNGKWLEVTIIAVSGNTVTETKQTSPTATVNL